MPLHILNKDIEQTVENISSQVKRHKNGVVADALKKAGISYEMSFGVSIVQLRNIAAKYKKDNNLAGALWGRNWRETMILATLLNENNEKGIQLLEEFTLSANTEEVFQQLGMNMLAGFSSHKRIILDYLTSETASKRIVASYAISRIFTGEGSHEGSTEYTRAIMSIGKPADYSRMEIIALSKAMAKVGFVSDIKKEEILSYFHKLVPVSNSWHSAYEIIKTEFDYR